MRLVKFAKQVDEHGAIIYPDPPTRNDEGALITNWGRTWDDGAGAIVGEYYGDEPLSDYVGADFPPIDYGPRQTAFYPDDLLAAFTADEFDAIDAASNVTIRRLKRRLEVRKQVLIRVTDAEYQDALALLESEALITSARREELSHGLPL